MPPFSHFFILPKIWINSEEDLEVGAGKCEMELTNVVGWSDENSKTIFILIHPPVLYYNAAFLKLWSVDHKWSSGSALVVLLEWTLVQKRQKK